MSVQVTVDGVPISAESGTMLTAALIKAGRWNLRSHPVTGEPRGALCGMGVCLECEVRVDGCLDVRACLTAVYAGMQVVTGEASA